MNKIENKNENKKVGNPTPKVIIILIILFAWIWFFFGGGLEKQSSNTLDNVYKQVSANSVEQYEIAKRQGDKIQICVQAGLVSASYLQEKNESEYQKWKAIQNSDCTKAGMPQY